MQSIRETVSFRKLTTVLNGEDKMDYDRKNQILHILKSQHYASVDDLCSQLFVSSSTVRRALKELQESHQIQRTRGGAYLIEGNTTEDPYAIRERQNVKAKQIIAGQAMQYIHNNMTIFLDSSSTVYIMAQMIEGFNNLCIITNSLKTALCLASKRGITIMCANGKPRNGTVSLVGQSTVNYLRNYNADAAFLSACGFDPVNGTSEASEEESFVKRTYIENARQKYLMCDTSKLEKVFLCRTASLNEFTRIITEDPAINAKLNRNNEKV
jgi:DeoR/GlpR family transcriptional regulator of sugar metabolism